MISKCTILIVFLALFAIQDTTGLHVERQDERSLNDLVNKAREAIERLQNIIRNVVENAKNQLATAKDAIITQAEKALVKAKAAIVAEVEKVKQQIDQIKHEAELVGVDVKECINENKKALQDIPKHIIQNLVKCVTDQVAKATAIIENSVGSIINLANQLTGLPNELSNCAAESQKFKCVAKVIAKAVGAIVTVPSQIAQNVQEIIKLVTGLETNLKVCAASKVLQATNEAAAVGAKVAKCVADKINE